MEKTNLQNLKIDAHNEIKKVQDLSMLNKISRKYLGRKGELRKIFNTLKSFGPEERKRIGRELNFIKAEIERALEKKREEIIKGKEKQEEKFDITLPGQKIKIGHLHPLTLVQQDIINIFQSMGFTVVEGPEIETEWYNFDALNVPPDHPARDMQDTLWVKQGIKEGPKKNLLMRTHTSAIQVRYMEKHKPPFRIIALGRVFRNERTDASHEIQFYQCEGLVIDKEISLVNFKALIGTFFDRFFNKNVEIRLRPSYFPFTEPSLEFDIKCLNCKGRGCSICQQTGWLEVIPGGMVHPNVLKAVGYNPDKWQGFAFGMGVDRLAMMKYKINDIRLFYSNDLRFLKQF